jgi:signal transduction histidine kinase/ligand-binding sensor domain-containing protein
MDRCESSSQHLWAGRIPGRLARQLARAFACWVGLLVLGEPGVSAVGLSSHQEFGAHSWNSDHGLPQNTVQAFCQDREGFLWIGTRFGLARFDGLEFQAFRPSDHPEFRDGSITALAEDAQGVLWMGLFDGLLRRHLGRITRVPSLEGERIWAIWPQSPGRLWIGLNRGLVIVTSDGSLTPFVPSFDSPAPPPTRVRSLAADGTGGLVVTTQRDWFHVQLDRGWVSRWEPELRTHAAPTPPMHQVHPTDWRAEPVAPGSSEELRRWIFSDIEHTPHDWGPRTHADGHGGWWFVTVDRTLFHAGTNGLHRLLPITPAPADAMVAAYTDGEGHHWVGGTVSGVTRLRSRVFQWFPIGEGSEAACFAVATDPGGGVWTASRSYLLHVGHESTRRWRIDSASATRQIHTLVPGLNGAWWLGWDRRGLFQWHMEPPDALPALVDLSGERPRALTVTRDGALWIGLTTGLVRRHGGDARRFDARDGLPHPDIRAIHEDRDGTLWVATYGGGIARLQEGRFLAISAKDGLSSDTAWGFLEDRTGALWIYGLRGLTRWRDGRLATVSREQGLFEDLTNQMMEDEIGHFWLGCNRAIYRVRADDLHAVADGSRSQMDALVFGVADGLPVAETNGESQPAAAQTPDGALWFPTPAGLVRVDPRQAPIRENPPRVHITRFRTESLVLRDERGDRRTAGTKAGEDAWIPPGQAHVIEAEFTSPSFGAPARARFRHRLHGYDTNWVDVGTRRLARYTNLSPGQYRLEVIACNDHGVWAKAPAQFAFRIAPHFHQTALFRVSVPILLLASGWLLHRLRFRFLRRQHALETQLRLARERERIARDMHDDVGTSLTRIGLLAERGLDSASAVSGPLREAPPSNPPTLPKLLGQIATTTREAAHAMDEIVWALNPGNDRLDQLAAYICQFAREYLEPTSIACRIEMPAELPDVPVASDLRHQILMVLKEGLQNIVRHAHATQVVVRFESTATCLRLNLTDNGRGFDPASPPAPQPGHGHGLSHLRHRMSELGGTLTVTGLPGRGTSLEAIVPLPRSWD